MRKKSILTDSKGRLNLGKKYASSMFLVEELENGEFLLRKATILPESEVWLHQNKNAKTHVVKGIDQARQRKLKSNAIDLDAFED